MDNMANTLFIRLEGHLQSWSYDSRFVLRSTDYAPSKSGVVGLICACAGLGRIEAKERLAELNKLSMGVRIDRQGVIIKDYQTCDVSRATTADRKSPQKEIEETIREYLSDASFLVVFHGHPASIAWAAKAVKNPIFVPYLGRKCCVPSRPLFETVEDSDCLEEALQKYPWRPRTIEKPPLNCLCVVETRQLPNAALSIYLRKDVLVSLIPHVLKDRCIKFLSVTPPIGDRLYSLPVKIKGKLSDDKKEKRLAIDKGLCVLCSLPAKEIHHVTYERAPNEDIQKDLRSVCKLCHEAITSIEYETCMSDRRLDPLDQETRSLIWKRREKFILQGY